MGGARGECPGAINERGKSLGGYTLAAVFSGAVFFASLAAVCLALIRSSSTPVNTGYMMRMSRIRGMDSRWKMTFSTNTMDTKQIQEDNL